MNVTAPVFLLPDRRRCGLTVGFNSFIQKLINDVSSMVQSPLACTVEFSPGFSHAVHEQNSHHRPSGERNGGFRLQRNAVVEANPLLIPAFQQLVFRPGLQCLTVCPALALVATTCGPERRSAQARHGASFDTYQLLIGE